MDDLHFPVFDQPLPPPKLVSTRAYVEFVIWSLNLRSYEERRKALAERALPTGKRFTLFPGE
ncbi:MAG: hypothetical protein A3A73_02515 [Omnitrophica bacterium RIFCSPLOWO2_01_FULL_50_24]|nr:MAG: hypothetical protein A3A73_02515 [Omnitrophica bacterium RIFCSPLOWO2_01_FULL_50_24]